MSFTIYKRFVVKRFTWSEISPKCYSSERIWLTIHENDFRKFFLVRGFVKYSLFFFLVSLLSFSCVYLFSSTPYSITYHYLILIFRAILISVLWLNVVYLSSYRVHYLYLILWHVCMHKVIIIICPYLVHVSLSLSFYYHYYYVLCDFVLSVH